MLYICALLLLGSGEVLMTLTRFSNLECVVLDPTYCAYMQCDLKPMSRGIVSLNVHANLLRGPFKNAKVNLSLWRKYNGFRPFLFNSTLDFCHYMARGNTKLSFENVFFDALRRGSNLNHSCPYADAIILRDMLFKEEFFKYFPLPSGEYKFQLMASTDNDWKTIVSIYINRTEE